MCPAKGSFLYLGSGVRVSEMLCRYFSGDAPGTDAGKLRVLQAGHPGAAELPGSRAGGLSLYIPSWSWKWGRAADSAAWKPDAETFP